MLRFSTSVIVLLSLHAATAWANPHPPAGSAVVEPFLGKATPTSIHIAWETSDGENTRVRYGLTSSLGMTETGDWETGFGAGRVHHVELENLQPDTRYFYQCVATPYSSSIATFRTPPTAATGESFTFTVYSDCQYGSNGTKHAEVVNDGIIDFYEDQYGGNIEDSLAFHMVSGDLVSTGSNHSHWTDHFFGQGKNLFRNVPLYPALGNHEANADLYYLYFDTFHNAPSGLDEHCYWFDYQNIRIITLDSNGSFANETQLNWLDGVLDDACSNDDIDFLFVQFHHPHKSESWTPGESTFSTTAMNRVSEFSSSCGKPSAHFYGHTHSYSRGQTRDHDHLMVNVATGMGSIDYWYDYPNKDYEEFQITLQEWGFVQMTVTTGEDPTFTLRRVSRGNDYVALDNVITDEITVRKNNTPPSTPVGVSPTVSDGAVFGDNVALQGSTYAESQGDIALASRWQVAESASGFSSPIIDQWKRRENWYRPSNGDGWYSENTVKDPDITRVILETPLPGCATLYWRVKYRDDALGWSEWSEPVAFLIGNSSAGNSAPIPAPDAEGIAVSTQLEWFPCIPADEYSVYFGTDATPDSGEFRGTQTQTSWDPGELELETSYYWRIDRHEGSKVVEGEVWTFTTIEALPTAGTGEWRFNDTNPSTNVAFEATYGESVMTPRGMTEGSDWAIGRTNGSTIPHIDGVEAGYVMLDNVHGSNSGLETYYMAPGNGGGGCCDVFHFTFIWDIFIPTDQYQLQCLWQGNSSNSNDGEFFLDCSDGGFWHRGDGYIGEDEWQKGEWFRIAHRVNYADDVAAIFVNGERLFADQSLQGDDWLYGGGSNSAIWMISDDGPDSDVSVVYCANLAIVDRLLPDATIKSLGGPNAEGIFGVEPDSIPGDLNGDGAVNGADLAHLLGYWALPGGDINGDGTTDGGDLSILLGAWTG